MSHAGSDFLSFVSTGDRGAGPAAAHGAPVVYVFCENPAVRQLLNVLIESGGWAAETLRCLADLQVDIPAPAPRCLVLDASLSGRAELDLLERIVAERPDTPVVFIVRDSDVSTIVRLMKAGASEVLTEPFRDEALLAALERALEQSRVVIGQEARARAIRARYVSLSRRERQIMALVAVGRLNKQIAGELGISEITVKAHRGRVMKKMAARSLPQLVIMHLRLGAGPAGGG